MNYYQRLKDLREDHDLSQADIAYFGGDWRNARGCKIEYEAELSKDIIATISCLEALGAVIKLGDGIIEVVKPIDKNNIPENPILDCNESGCQAEYLNYSRSFSHIGISLNYLFMIAIFKPSILRLVWSASLICSRG